VFLDREFFSFSALPHYRSNKTVFKTACAKHQKYMCDHNGTDKEFRFVYRGTWDDLRFVKNTAIPDLEAPS
jgi:hypothetical protein